MLKLKLKKFNHFRDNIFHLKEFPDRLLYLIEGDNKQDSSIKELYEFIQKHRMDYMDYDTEIYMLHELDSPGHLYIYNEAGLKLDRTFKTLSLPAGLYLVGSVKTESDKRIPEFFDTFPAEAERRGLNLEELKISIGNESTAFYSRQENHFELQMKVR